MIAFIDTEVSPQTEKVADYGAVREDGAVLHTRSAQEFNAFASGCDTLCGHNILNFGLHYLHLKEEHVCIDTLPLSPLLFPRKPYHRLVKDDKLLTDELNNPVNDAKKARDLFYDEVEAWKALPARRQAIFQGLLGNTREFRGFFDWMGRQDYKSSRAEAQELKGLRVQEFLDESSDRAERKSSRLMRTGVIMKRIKTL